MHNILNNVHNISLKVHLRKIQLLDQYKDLKLKKKKQFKFNNIFIFNKKEKIKLTCINKSSDSSTFTWWTPIS